MDNSDQSKTKNRDKFSSKWLLPAVLISIGGLLFSNHISKAYDAHQDRRAEQKKEIQLETYRNALVEGYPNQIGQVISELSASGWDGYEYLVSLTNDKGLVDKLTETSLDLLFYGRSAGDYGLAFRIAGFIPENQQLKNTLRSNFCAEENIEKLEGGISSMMGTRDWGFYKKGILSRIEEDLEKKGDTSWMKIMQGKRQDLNQSIDGMVSKYVSSSKADNKPLLKELFGMYESKIILRGNTYVMNPEIYSLLVNCSKKINEPAYYEKTVSINTKEEGYQRKEYSDAKEQLGETGYNFSFFSYVGEVYVFAQENKTVKLHPVNGFLGYTLHHASKKYGLSNNILIPSDMLKELDNEGVKYDKLFSHVKMKIAHLFEEEYSMIKIKSL